MYINIISQHLGEFLDTAENGAIFFSLGSTAKSSDLSPETVKLFFNVLSKLPQKILWKWDDVENVPGKSDNILFDKWVPQNDVLAHKNLRLFITHGGKGSVVESQYHGVPMIVIPLFGDQTFNAKEIEGKMYGISINHKTVTKEHFEKVVNEVLENRKYLTNVKLFSKVYKDRPITAKDNAVFWMEYVLRHKGARHLQSPAGELD
uniref:UDP-glucuronosyltransferase n=1 Tax=Megaselia scalaris TaxID=36166 RepID=T1GWU5_MEGSC